jgi:hypothetical protein
MRCLKKKPEERFQTIDELSAALRARAQVTALAMTDHKPTAGFRSGDRGRGPQSSSA